jgi:hypothetical protein
LLDWDSGFDLDFAISDSLRRSNVDVVTPSSKENPVIENGFSVYAESGPL